MTRVAQRRSSLRGARSFIAGGLASALVALLLLGANACPALADADPASDVLLAHNAFFPYRPAVSSQLYSAVNGTLGAAARVGLPLKVAIIGSSEDLGAIPELFGHPQTYATFLDREISFNHPQPLLVVMPSGFGLANARFRGGARRAVGTTETTAPTALYARRSSRSLLWRAQPAIPSRHRPYRPAPRPQAAASQSQCCSSSRPCWWFWPASSPCGAASRATRDLRPLTRRPSDSRGVDRRRSWPERRNRQADYLPPFGSWSTG